MGGRNVMLHKEYRVFFTSPPKRILAFNQLYIDPTRPNDHSIKTMNQLVLVSLLSIGFAAIVSCDDKYTTKYDGLDVNEIKNNRRLLLGYCRCLLGKSPCSPDGAELKKNLKDAIETKCSRCSEKQKEGAKIILRHLIDHEREECWNPLEKVYDPTGKYMREYQEEAEKHGIKLPN